MAKLKDIAGEPIHGMAYEVMKKYHPELHEAEVKMTIFMVTAVDKFGASMKHADAITVRGIPALAMVKKATTKEMKLGSGDFIMEIDSWKWNNELDEAERVSLLDHEINHIMLKYDNKSGLPLATLMGRPELLMRKHDVEVGVFLRVIARHKKKAVDYQGVYNLLSVTEQALEQGE